MCSCAQVNARGTGAGTLLAEQVGALSLTAELSGAAESGYYNLTVLYTQRTNMYFLGVTKYFILKRDFALAEAPVLVFVCMAFLVRAT